MPESEIWKEWVEPFDVFISYARVDNAAEPEMISAFVEQLEADFLRFAPETPLKVFFDKKSILDGQYWQDVLRKGLRQSKVMVAFLSPAYFRSEWCRKEWEEYVLVEQSRTYPGEALIPIFIVAPGDLRKQIPDSASEWWDDVSARNAVVEIQPFWPQGRTALHEEIVAKRLLQLEHNIQERIEHGRILMRVPRDIRNRNPNFVGRRKELAALRDALSRHDMVGLCAVNGVGGIGKSSVAREYAFLFRPEYLGGQFEIDLSTAKSVADVQSALVRIARSYLKAIIPYELPEDRQYELAKAVFHNLSAGEKVLLLLDNLNEDAVSLVARRNRDLYPSLEKVHMLVTTRAEPRSLGGIEAISLDILPIPEALDLLFRYRSFARQLNDPDYLAAREGTYQLRENEDATGDAEWKAALAIVQRLGRHSLAVALVGAYLGSYPEINYCDFADQLREQGIGVALNFVGNDEMVQNLIAHPVTLIGPLFEQSVARLSPLAVRTLEYAALLPPDLVPLAWLQQLVEQDVDMAESLLSLPFQSPPWEDTLRTLSGLDYLKGEPFARMHRVVQEVILARMSDEDRSERTQSVQAFVENRTALAHDNQQPYTSVSEVDAVVLFVQSNAKMPDRLIGRTAMWVVPRLQELGRLRSAVEMASLSAQILRPLADSDPRNALWQHDLSVSLSQQGELAALQENIPEAKRLFSESLGIRHRLLILDPTNGSLQRDFFISSSRLADIAVASGDLEEAKRGYKAFLGFNRRAIDSMPANLKLQRDVTVTLEKLGEIALIQGDLTAAEEYFSEMYEIRQRLADSDPDNATWKRDLSVAIEKLGELALEQGNLPKAQRLFGESHRILQRLADSDPGNATWQRDLAASHHNLAMLAQQEGNNAQSEVELRACFDVLNGMCQRSMHLDPEMEQVYQQLSKIFEV